MKTFFFFLFVMMVNAAARFPYATWTCLTEYVFTYQEISSSCILKKKLNVFFHFIFRDGQLVCFKYPCKFIHHYACFLFYVRGKEYIVRLSIYNMFGISK